MTKKYSEVARIAHAQFQLLHFFKKIFRILLRGVSIFLSILFRFYVICKDFIKV